MFYVLHPGYIFYNPIDYSFSFKLLTESSKKLDLFFNDVIPLFWKNGWLILPILSIQSLILLLQKNAKGAAGLLGGLILIIISLGISKVHEGNLNIFYPLSRMYLGIPVLSALFIPQIQIRYNSFWWIVLLNVGIAVFVFKNRHPDQSIRQKLSIENDVMSFYKVSEVDESCMQLREIAQLHNVSLIISLGKLYDEMFGCTCLYDDFPETLVNYHERRTWRFEEEEQAVRTNILLVGNYLTENSISLLNHNPNVQKLNSPSWYNVYLISNNKLPTLKLLQTFEIGFRKYK
jgi:hypothetical protein